MTDERERLRETARSVLDCGVGNLSGDRYRRRVAAFDALDDALEAALAHDRPSGSALSGSSAPEASKALTDAIHEIAQCHEALEYAAGFMADPEGLMHRREAWLAKVNAVLAARLRPSASDDAEVTEAKPETPA